MTGLERKTELEDVVIEEASPKDFDEWYVLFQQYLEFYKTALADETIQFTWKRIIDPEGPIYCAIAKHEGKVVGFATYLFHPATWAQTDYCYMDDLFVSPQVRGRHIGKRLIEYVQQKAKANSAASMYWHTQTSNLRGQRLYDWVGQKSGDIMYKMSV